MKKLEELSKDYEQLKKYKALVLIPIPVFTSVIVMLIYSITDKGKNIVFFYLLLGLIAGPHLAVMIAAYSRADNYLIYLKDEIESIQNSNTGIEFSEDLSQYDNSDFNKDAYERYLKSKRMMK